MLRVSPAFLYVDYLSVDLLKTVISSLLSLCVFIDQVV